MQLTVSYAFLEMEFLSRCNMQQKSILSVIMLFSLLFKLYLFFSIVTIFESFVPNEDKVRRIRVLPMTRRDPALSLDLNSDIRVIILLTSFRTGSTFLGQIFDNNPKFQYLFEPFHEKTMETLHVSGHLVGAQPYHTASDLQMLYLQQILHNCTVRKTAFYEKFEYCGTPQENILRFNSTGCDSELQMKRGLFEAHEEICKLRRTVVVKLIRLQNLSDIMKIAHIKSANIKIIHLLRNPVPLMMSRKWVASSFTWRNNMEIEYLDEVEMQRIKLAWESYECCRDALESIRFVNENIHWLKHRYMSINHRELSLNPLEISKQIYNFINETITDEVVRMLTNITSGSGHTVSDENSGGLESGAQNIYQNSSDVVNRWRNLKAGIFKLWNVQSIEQECKSLIRFINEQFALDSMPTSNILYKYEK